MTLLQEKWGGEHPYTLSIIPDLELSYQAQGRLEEAEDIAREIEEICKQKPELKVSDSLASLSIRATRGSTAGDFIDDSSVSST